MVRVCSCEFVGARTLVCTLLFFCIGLMLLFDVTEAARVSKRSKHAKKHEASVASPTPHDDLEHIETAPRISLSSILKSTRSSKKKLKSKKDKKQKIRDTSRVVATDDSITIVDKEDAVSNDGESRNSHGSRNGASNSLKASKKIKDRVQSGDIVTPLRDEGDGTLTEPRGAVRSAKTKKSKKANDKKAKSKKQKQKSGKKVKVNPPNGASNLENDEVALPPDVQGSARANVTKPKKQKKSKQVRIKTSDLTTEDLRKSARNSTKKSTKLKKQGVQKVEIQEPAAAESDLFNNDSTTETSKAKKKKQKSGKKAKGAVSSAEDIDSDETSVLNLEDNTESTGIKKQKTKGDKKMKVKSSNSTSSKKKDKKNKDKKFKHPSTTSDGAINAAHNNVSTVTSSPNIVANIGDDVTTASLNDDTKPSKKGKKKNNKKSTLEGATDNAITTVRNNVDNDRDDVNAPNNIDNTVTNSPVVQSSKSSRKRKNKIVGIKESPVVYNNIGLLSNDVTNHANNEVTSTNEIDSFEDTSPNSLNPSSSAEQPPTNIPASKKPAKSPRPHIIFVIADDLGFNDIGYHTKGTGCVAHTPNINNLALSGVRLENYYVQPICTPTRASLLTGRYPIRMGLQHGNIERCNPTCLPQEETTLPDKLRDLGYATHAVGKWHLGFSSPDCLPTRRGFDSYLGIITGSSSHNKYTLKKARTLYSNESVEWRYTGQHSSELYTEHAMDIIKRHDRSEPLFLYLSYQAVHSPIQSPDVYQSYYKERFPSLWRKYELGSNKQRLGYLGLLESMDVGIMNVTQILKEKGMWENTVLVFTSDNGGRTKFSASNWPLRGEKNTLWEGGIKGIGFVNSPLLSADVIGTVQTGLMHVSDWFPTLVEGVAGGIAEGRLPLDGINMWPTIAEGHPSPRWEILHNIDTWKNPSKHRLPTPYKHDQWILYDYLPFNPHTYAAIRFDGWKLITGFHRFDYSGWVPPKESFKPSINMSTIDNQGIYLRLYDLTEDPEEKNNIALLNRHIVFKLLHRLAFYHEDLVLPEYMYNDPAAKPFKRKGQELVWKPWRS